MMIGVKNKKYICEYIWITEEGEIRSKTRVLNIENEELLNVENIPEWEYSENYIETFLKPCVYFKNPLRKIENSILVLCDTYDTNNNPVETNYRIKAKKIFDMKLEEEPWFGIEQEYCIYFLDETNRYTNDSISREMVEHHFKICVEAGLEMFGMNAELYPIKWEFQMGPLVGINAADQLIIARYFLERIAEKYNAYVSYDTVSKPNINCYSLQYPYNYTTAGGHINFSTKNMRSYPDGLQNIISCMSKLEKKHQEHIKVYGDRNEFRLIGNKYISHINNFTYGIGSRDTSVRITNRTVKNKCGYFEDRRPAANIDPYQATSIIFKTCCLEESDK